MLISLCSLKMLELIPMVCSDGVNKEARGKGVEMLKVSWHSKGERIQKQEDGNFIVTYYTLPIHPFSSHGLILYT